MSVDKTTVSLGFKADLSGLQQVASKTAELTRLFDSLAHSVKKVHDASTGGGGGGVVPPSGGGAGGLFGKMGLPGGGIGKKALGMGLVAGGAFGLALGASALITQGIRSAKEYTETLGPLAKQLSVVGSGQVQFVNTITETSKAIGVARSELLQYTQAYVNLAGAQKGGVAGQINAFGLFAKGMGLNQGATMQRMGSLAQSGAFGTYSANNMRAHEFAALIADAVAEGGMKGREGELLTSINSLVNVQLQALTRPQGMTSAIGMLTAMNRSGQPGLMGAHGANILAQLSNGIRNPGAGDFGELFMYKALGGGDYFDYKMRQEEGAFGPSNNLGAVLGTSRKFFPNEKVRLYALKQLMPGLSMHQLRGVSQAYSASGGSEGFLKMMGEMTGDDLAKISPEKYGIMAELYRSGGGANALKVLDDSRLGGLKGKFDENSKLEDIIRAVAETPFVATTEEKMMTELTTINIHLEKIGEKAIPHLTKVVESINDGVAAVANFFGPGEGKEVVKKNWKINSMEDVGNIAQNGLLGMIFPNLFGVKRDKDPLDAMPGYKEQASSLKIMGQLGMLPQALYTVFQLNMRNQAETIKDALNGGRVGDGSAAKGR